MPSRFGWEQVSENLWTCDAGYIDKKDRAGLWTGHVYRNVRVGQGWVESKKGFDTASAAIAWVENNAEL